MKNIFRFILIAAISLLSFTALSQKELNTKAYNLATAGSSIALNLTSDAQLYFVSGVKILSAPYAVTVSGTPTLGKTLILFWDGTSITTSSNVVTVLGVTLTDQQAKSKMIFLSIYKGSAWETRSVRDAKTTQWISKEDLGSGVVDDTTLQITSGGGIRIKPLGITTAHINVSAAIPYSKLSLTAGIVNADVATGAAVALNKLATTTASRLIVSDGSGVLVPATVTATEAGYLSGVTSAIQTQLGTKTTSGNIVNADVASGAAIVYSKLALTAGIVNADLSASAAIDWSKINSGVTSTEMGYLAGVTSSVQTQLTAAGTGKITYATLTGNTALDAGTLKRNYILSTGSGTIDATLPRANTCPSGTTVEFIQKGINAGRIAAFAGDDISNQLGVSSVLTAMSGNGGGLMVVSDGVLTWHVVRYY